MGSPLSPILANLFLYSMESEIIPRNPNIKFWTRYIDDVFAFIRSRFKNKILDDLNSFHEKNIQFTTECEQDNQLPFLDVLIMRNDNGSLQFKVYRKPTHTGRYLNYKSFHINNHKLSVIDSLVDRAYSICEPKYINDELIHITNSLEKNNYPNRIIKNRMEYLKTNRNISSSDPKPRLILPFIGNDTYKLVRVIRNTIDVNFGFKTVKMIHSMICNHKNKYKQKNNGIYKIYCDSCDSCYIGETCREFEIRLKEHIADSKHQRILSSAVALHMVENNNHKIDLKNSRIIEKEDKYLHRKYKEAIHINSEKNIMNLDKGYYINPFWTPILKSFYNKTWNALVTKNVCIFITQYLSQ